LIAPSSLSSCNNKQFGLLMRRRNPNNPHINVLLQYYKKVFMM
jgi:hypothetical protein